jgi:hypothetical protein
MMAAKTAADCAGSDRTMGGQLFFQFFTLGRVAIVRFLRAGFLQWQRG